MDYAKNNKPIKLARGVHCFDTFIHACTCKTFLHYVLMTLQRNQSLLEHSFRAYCKMHPQECKRLKIKFKSDDPKERMKQWIQNHKAIQFDDLDRAFVVKKNDDSRYYFDVHSNEFRSVALDKVFIKLYDDLLAEKQVADTRKRLLEFVESHYQILRSMLSKNSSYRSVDTRLMHSYCRQFDVFNKTCRKECLTHDYIKDMSKHYNDNRRNIVIYIRS